MLYEALLIVERNLLALKSYVSTYGLVAGAQLYAKIGADGLPNGIFSWLELDLSDGDTALDDMIGAAVKDASDGDLAYDDALYYYNPSKVDLSKTTLAGEIIYQDASDGDTYLDDAVRFIAADLADGDSSLDDVFAGATKGGSKLPLKMNLQFFAKNGGSKTIVVQYGDEFGKMGRYVENPQIKVDWTEYAEHAAERMQQRGMTRELIDHIVENGKVLSQNGGNKYVYITQEGVAVVSKEGKLITGWTSSDYDEAMIEIVNKLFGE